MIFLKGFSMRWLLSAILIILASCSMMKSKQVLDDSMMSPEAKAKIAEARQFINSGKLDLAIKKLVELEDQKINPLEKATKYNLKGVIKFNLNEIERSLLNFEVAEKYAPKNSQIFSQIQLNMASAHYKLGQLSELKNRFSKIETKNLSSSEIKKYHQLYLVYGKKFENNLMVAEASLHLMNDLKNSSDIQNSSLFPDLKDAFKKLASGQKIKLFESYDDQKNMTAAFLAQMEADERYLNGDKSGAQDIVNWLNAQYGDYDEIKKFLRDFELRLDNSSKMSLSDIGLILPLTGEKSSFGQKALSGVDTGLKVLGLNENLKIHTKDSVDSPSQGAQAVLDLIKERKVAFIIGGLFPESAKAEYLEARKYGVLYISLSQINLPKEEKNHHLIEVQGSIESQIETLLSDEMIQKFGTRIGIIFPENEGGKAYADELWRKSREKKVEITALATFQKNTHDYRDTAQLFLGLKHQRERSEELNILDDVYALEKSSIRRVQTLPPMLDFDWLFLATYPHEAIGLIPTLGYYDANRIKVVGGPSWVSHSLVKEQKNLGTLYFIGEDPKDINQVMLSKFQEIYGRPAGLIEILSLDAMKLGVDALNSAKEAEGRDQFDAAIKDKTLNGLTTSWSFKDGVWMKKMNSMTITRGEIVKTFGQ